MPVQWDMCEKSFIENSAVNKHKKVHTDEKPFKGD
jgi:hypothetical protein